MEEKKKGKGLKIVLAIFIILFLLAAGALGYGYTKYKELKNDNTNLNTKYENVNKDLEKTKSDLDNSNKELKESESKSNNKEAHNYVGYQNINLYAIGYLGSILSYKGNMYLVNTSNVFSDGSATTVFSETMIKKALKGGKYGFNYKIEKDDDGQSYTELDWKSCSKKNECNNFIMDLGVKESEVNRAVIGHYPGASDASEYHLIVKKDGTVWRTGSEKIDLEHNNVDNVEVTCKAAAYEGMGCKKFLFKLTLKDGTTVEEIKDKFPGI